MEETAKRKYHEHCQELAVDSLVQGCVTAFVEFFQLSHREPVCVDPLANKMFSIPDDKLEWVQSTLLAAERYRRSSDWRLVYDCHIQLANYFEDAQDIATALHFHELGLEGAKQSAEKDLEGIANENFGNIHKRLGNIKQAISFHETHLRLAEAARNESMKKQASKNLFGVYMARAAEFEKALDFHAAAELYEKSMHTARATADTTAEAEAFHKLGDINVLLEDMERALFYQRHFLNLSQTSKNPDNEVKAQISLAQLQESMGQTDDAEVSLNRALQIARERHDKVAESKAAEKLGLLHNKQAKFVMARQYLEQNYELAKKRAQDEHHHNGHHDTPNGTTTTNGKSAKPESVDVDYACILVGIARGNHEWSNGYVKQVGARDLDRVLWWQCEGEMTR